MLNYHFIRHDKKNCYYIILLNILFHFLSISLASEQNWKPSRWKQNYIYQTFFKKVEQTLPDLNINDCSTQRNLNQIGINQSKKMENYLPRKTLRLIKYYLVNGVGARIQLDMHLEISRNFQL